MSQKVCDLCKKPDKFIRHPGTCSDPFHDDFLRTSEASQSETERPTLCPQTPSCHICGGQTKLVPYCSACERTDQAMTVRAPETAEQFWISYNRKTRGRPNILAVAAGARLFEFAEAYAAECVAALTKDAHDALAQEENKTLRKLLRECFVQLKALHPMNPEEPCVIYDVLARAAEALKEE